MSANKPSHGRDSGLSTLSPLPTCPQSGAADTAEELGDVVKLAWDGTGLVMAAPRLERGFVLGPLPLHWFLPAMALPGKALHVAVALWHMYGITKCPEITVSNVLTKRFSVRRDAKHRALRALERAGLVSVSSGKGRSSRVTLLALTRPGNPVRRHSAPCMTQGDTE